MCTLFLDCYTGDSKDIELYQVFAAEIFSEVFSIILPRCRFDDTHLLYVNGLLVK